MLFGLEDLRLEPLVNSKSLSNGSTQATWLASTSLGQAEELLCLVLRRKGWDWSVQIVEEAGQARIGSNTSPVAALLSLQELFQRSPPENIFSLCGLFWPTLRNVG